MKFIVPERKKQYDYVGFDVEKNNSQFIFPCQFVGDIESFDEKEKRKMARQILKIIKKAKNELFEGGSDETLFQFNSMIWLIQNFIEKGYYFENEVITKPNVSGKVNWKKTIKSNNIWFDDGNIIYNKIFSNVKLIDDDAIISQIYKYCLDVAIKNLGFVFGIEKTEKSIYSIKDLNFMTYYLKNRCNSTFLDYKKLLFGHMLNILLNGNLSKEYNAIFANDKEFEYVFELLVDNSFGLKDKKKFNPTAKYIFGKKEMPLRSLRPDTILEYENGEQKCCCVIDAKYYSFNYGEENSKGLPEQSSVNKQFVYQKFIEKNVEVEKDKFYDKVTAVFFLPFCAKENEDKIQYMNGYAEAKWNNNDITGKVYLFKVDLKTLFDEFYGNDKNLKTKFIEKLNKELENVWFKLKLIKTG